MSQLSKVIKSFCCGSSRINGHLKASRPLDAKVVIQVDSHKNKIIELRKINEVNHA